MTDTTAPAPKAPKTAPVRALVAVWDLNGDRREPGEVFDMTIPEAKALIAAGKAADGREIGGGE